MKALTRTLAVAALAAAFCVTGSVAPAPAEAGARVVVRPAPRVKVVVGRPARCEAKKKVWVPGHWKRVSPRRTVWVAGHWTWR